MSRDELSGPDLVGVVADADAVGLPYVVIGGFSVIFHGYVRATKDSDLLVPDGAEANRLIGRFLERIEARRFLDEAPVDAAEVAGEEHLRVNSRHGIIDVMRGGTPPLDFDTVFGRADEIEWRGHAIRVASLSSVVGFKRLAGRPQDKLDLTELEAIHGELPRSRSPASTLSLLREPRANRSRKAGSLTWLDSFGEEVRGDSPFALQDRFDRRRGAGGVGEALAPGVGGVDVLVEGGLGGGAGRVQAAEREAVDGEAVIASPQRLHPGGVLLVAEADGELAAHGVERFDEGRRPGWAWAAGGPPRPLSRCLAWGASALSAVAAPLPQPGRTRAAAADQDAAEQGKPAAGRGQGRHPGVV